VFARKLLNRIFGTESLNLDDLKETQAELESLESEMHARVRRIPMTTDEPSYQNNDGFNTWAKLLLWSMGGMCSSREICGIVFSYCLCGTETPAQFQ
jgi:hypothetical protein